MTIYCKKCKIKEYFDEKCLWKVSGDQMEQLNGKYKKNTAFVKLESHENHAGEVIASVYSALKERGYNPINQMVGYIMSGDPTYITNYKNARSTIAGVERDELLEEFVSFYLKNISEEK